MTARTMSVAVNNDAELVGASLAGDRDAFGHIVARYQSFVGSASDDIRLRVPLKVAAAQRRSDWFL
jgi:hypothetical protein